MKLSDFDLRPGDLVVSEKGKLWEYGETRMFKKASPESFPHGVGPEMRITAAYRPSYVITDTAYSGHQMRLEKLEPRKAELDTKCMTNERALCEALKRAEAAEKERDELQAVVKTLQNSLDSWTKGRRRG